MSRFSLRKAVAPPPEPVAVAAPIVAAVAEPVHAAPTDDLLDVRLRLHLAELLLDAGDAGEAIIEIVDALRREPTSELGRALMIRAVGEIGPIRVGMPAPAEFDWDKAEEQLADMDNPLNLFGPLVVDQPFDPTGPIPAMPAVPDAPAVPDSLAFDVVSSSVRLADVGGMAEVKKRLEAAFLAPMRNPRLRAAYGKSLRGGLLLYGPPGCGKTFLARALAGELGARFLPVGLHDVLDMWVGGSERNLHELFVTARRAAPCVLFLDEIDALGHKRSQLRDSALRGAVNQLLTELDGVWTGAEGVFVLAATNYPWDVDGALRRPGRFDRTVLVSPPDEATREAILEYHLRDRPVTGVDVRALAKRTRGFSGADLAHLCETATERALLDSASTGSMRLIEMADLVGALDEIRPSIGAWLATARNVVEFGNTDGCYDDLRGYLKREKLL